jgi:hypothetical protein
LESAVAGGNLDIAWEMMKIPSSAVGMGDIGERIFWRAGAALKKAKSRRHSRSHNICIVPSL